ncbi:hypothetical protein QBC40DRAFT_352086 [Triangularia verruculosa]|uniref:Uncharacterized protein n=1 Tax=Triangularia verruculosa TaxID=2587418 RepID=A0AAN7ARP8_9PEZI|nr:hypothetical protein QBC40DRAFT_352086 [Triangularia verruculosa]
MLFSLTHLPALVLITANLLGGIWPIFDAPAAMLEFGFGPKIAHAPEAMPVMINGQARTTVLGAITLVFYLRGKYEEVDTLMAVYGIWAGLVDSALVWKWTGNRRWAAFRLGASWAFGVWGLMGLTGGAV